MKMKADQRLSHGLSGQVLNPYFDITAFQPLPSQHTLSPGPPALDELRAPGTRSLNLSVFKSLPIRERLRLEVRMEGTGGGSRAMQGSARLVF